ncbi:MAG: SRPBCC family protein [Sphingobacteriaceae bacterium]|nr:SRPBCC family protein [Sphingobacteriaceae bacterium]
MTILTVILIIIALPMLIALFVKKEYNIERNIIINKPRQEVFDYVRLLKNQENYSKWVMADPDMKKEYIGTDGTPGFIYSWNGNNKAGEGEQEIITIVEGERLDLEIRFKRPFEGKAFTPLSTESLTDGKTKLGWGMYGKSNYPMNLMTQLMKGVLAKDIDISLNKLKAILEKKQ